MLIGVGLWNGYRPSRRIPEELEDGTDERHGATLGDTSGVVGLCARMVVFALIGVFVVKAATIQPTEAIGLDGALQKLASQSYGSWLLGIVAAGLLAYAVFCFFEARYREV